MYVSKEFKVKIETKYNDANGCMVTDANSLAKSLERIKKEMLSGLVPRNPRIINVKMQWEDDDDA